MKEKKEMPNVEEEEEKSFLTKKTLFLKSVLLSIYPDEYLKFSQRRYYSGILYFFSVVLLSGIILMSIFLFNTDKYSITFDSYIDKFTKLNFTGEMELNETIVLFDRKIVVANQANYTDENILITHDAITRKPFKCMIFKPLCWFSDATVTTGLNDYGDVLAYKEDFKKILVFAFLLMIPGLVLLYLIYVAIKALLFITLLSVVTALVVMLITNYKLTFRQIFLIGIYASTILIIAEPFNLLVHSLYYIHVILFMIFFFIGVNLVGENKRRF